MEIGNLEPAEWEWMAARSAQTAWLQLSPDEQAVTAPPQVAARVSYMLAEALRQPGSAALVARANGRSLGYLVVTVMPDELAGDPVGLFLDIYVEPDWRRKGVGDRLTAAGEDHCRRIGLRRVRRNIAAHNQPSLRHAMRDGCQVERYVLVKAL